MQYNHRRSGRTEVNQCAPRMFTRPLAEAFEPRRLLAATLGVTYWDGFIGPDGPVAPGETVAYSYRNANSEYLDQKLSQINRHGVITTLESIIPDSSAYELIGVDNNGDFLLSDFLHLPSILLSNSSIEPLTYPGSVSTSAVRMNPNGQVLLNVVTSNQKVHAMIYASGTYTDLASLVDPNSSVYGNDINSSGDVVGYVTDGSTASRGFLYHSGSLSYLSKPAGIGSSDEFVANRINDTGKIVASSIQPSGQYKMFRGTSGSWSFLSDQVYEILGFNDLGDILTKSVGSAFATHTLYDVNGVAHPLAELAPSAMASRDFFTFPRFDLCSDGQLAFARLITHTASPLDGDVEITGQGGYLYSGIDTTVRYTITNYSSVHATGNVNVNMLIEAAPTNGFGDIPFGETQTIAIDLKPGESATFEKTLPLPVNSSDQNQGGRIPTAHMVVQLHPDSSLQAAGFADHQIVSPGFEFSSYPDLKINAVTIGQVYMGFPATVDLTISAGPYSSTLNGALTISLQLELPYNTIPLEGDPLAEIIVLKAGQSIHRTMHFTMPYDLGNTGTFVLDANAKMDGYGYWTQQIGSFTIAPMPSLKATLANQPSHTIVSGNPVEFDVTITNTSAQQAKGLVFFDCYLSTLPEIDGNWYWEPMNPASQTVNIAAGDSATVHVNANSGGLPRAYYFIIRLRPNFNEITGADAADYQMVSHPITIADWSSIGTKLELNPPDTLFEGDSISYSLHASVSGGTPVTGVLEFELGLGSSSSRFPVELNFNNVGPGELVTVTGEIAVPAIGPYVYTSEDEYTVSFKLLSEAYPAGVNLVYVDFAPTSLTVHRTADLKGTMLPLGPVSPGGATIADVTIRNGDVPFSGSATVDVYLETAGAMGNGDVLVGSTSIDSVSLGALRSQPVVVNITIPDTTADGTYYLVARIRSESVHPEVSLDNNVFSSEAFLVGRFPVLEIEWIKPPKFDTYRVGEKADFHLRLKNTGNADATGTAAINIPAADLTGVKSANPKIHLKPGKTLDIHTSGVMLGESSVADPGPVVLSAEVDFASLVHSIGKHSSQTTDGPTVQIVHQLGGLPGRRFADAVIPLYQSNSIRMKLTGPGKVLYTRGYSNQISLTIQGTTSASTLLLESKVVANTLGSSPLHNPELSQLTVDGNIGAVVTKGIFLDGIAAFHGNIRRLSLEGMHSERQDPYTGYSTQNGIVFDGSKSASLQINKVDDEEFVRLPIAANIVARSRLASVTIGEISSQPIAIVAPAISKLSSPHNLSVDLTLTGDNGKFALGSVSAGDLYIPANITGNVGTITAKGSLTLTGVVRGSVRAITAAESGTFELAAGRIDSVRVGGLALGRIFAGTDPGPNNVLFDSDDIVSAATIGRIDLGSTDAFLRIAVGPTLSFEPGGYNTITALVAGGRIGSIIVRDDLAVGSRIVAEKLPTFATIARNKIATDSDIRFQING